MLGWWSGQSYLTVNQAPSGFVGSNPTPSTHIKKRGSNSVFLYARVVMKRTYSNLVANEVSEDPALLDLPPALVRKQISPLTYGMNQFPVQP